MPDRELREVAELLHSWRSEPVPSEAPTQLRREATQRVIERTLRRAARERRRRRVLRWVWPAGAAACLVLGVAWGHDALLGSAGRDAPATSADGAPAPAASGAVVRSMSGFLTARGHEGLKLVPSGTERRLEAGDVLTTPSDGRALMGLAGGGRVTLAATTEIEIPHAAPGLEQFNLNAGRINVEVPRHTQRRRTVVVRTPQVDVVVHGTAFNVEVSEPAPGASLVTRVHVDRGIVWIVEDGNRVAELRAGDAWSSAGEVGAEASGASSEPERSGQLDVNAAQVPLHRRAGVKGLVKKGSVKSGAGRVASAASAPRESEPAAEAPKSEAAGEEPVVPSARLAAENREFQAALGERNRGNLARAVRLFEAFLAHHPSSVLAQEAKVERFRAMQRMGRSAAAASAARQYLAEYEHGFAREEARRLVFAPRSSEESASQGF